MTLYTPAQSHAEQPGSDASTQSIAGTQTVPVREGYGGCWQLSHGPLGCQMPPPCPGEQKPAAISSLPHSRAPPPLPVISNHL